MAGEPRRHRSPAESPASERLVVGRVRGLHGLKGAVRVEVLTDRAERFEPGALVFEEGSARPLTIVERVEESPPGILVRFAEVRSRTAAERLRDAYLEAPVEPAALDEGAVWWHEVEGATVTTTTGEALGQVEDVFRAGEGEVFVVRGGARGEVLVPAVRDIVVEFAPRQGRLVVDPDALDLEPLRPRRPRGRRSSRRTPSE